MKISFYLLSGLFLTILVGCSNNQKKDDNKAIIGIWQNTTTPNAAVEFTREGDYYLRINGERLSIDDTIKDKYSYDPLAEGNNLIIYGNPKAGNTQSKLVVISPERIKISLVSQGSIVSEAEFTKVKD
ncbi:MAG: hypothetical protein Q7U54_16485 [Bacteroidales bacterium]|nr:hypothetical protein [Bacteroidales bacterium]